MVFGGEGLLYFCRVVCFDVLKFGHVEVFACGPDHFFIEFLIDFPELDAAGVGGEELEVFAHQHPQHQALENL
jgi:hypothetical protein